MSRKTMILRARMVLRMTYPGPAKDSLSLAIITAGLLANNNDGAEIDLSRRSKDQRIK